MWPRTIGDVGALPGDASQTCGHSDRGVGGLGTDQLDPGRACTCRAGGWRETKLITGWLRPRGRRVLAGWGYGHPGKAGDGFRVVCLGPSVEHPSGRVSRKQMLGMLARTGGRAGWEGRDLSVLGQVQGGPRTVVSGKPKSWELRAGRERGWGREASLGGGCSVGGRGVLGLSLPAPLVSCRSPTCISCACSGTGRDWCARSPSPTQREAAEAAPSEAYLVVGAGHDLHSQTRSETSSVAPQSHRN